MNNIAYKSNETLVHNESKGKERKEKQRKCGSKSTIFRDTKWKEEEREAMDGWRDGTE